MFEGYQWEIYLGVALFVRQTRRLVVGDKHVAARRRLGCGEARRLLTAKRGLCYARRNNTVVTVVRQTAGDSRG